MPICSVIVPWCDRPELALALSRNDAVFGPRKDVELIVCSTGRSDMLRTLVALARTPYVRCVEIPGAVFNRSLCINLGTLASTGEFILLLDADMLVTVDFLDEAYRLLRSGRRFVSMRYIYETLPTYEPDGTDWSFLAEVVRTKELRTHDGRRAVLISRNKEETRPGDGQIMLSRRDMIAAGGMNASLLGWGFDDTDLQLRLQFGLGLAVVEFGEITHMTHHAAKRDFAQWRRNSQMAYENYKRGNFKGTLDDDAARWCDKLVELERTW